MFESFIVLIVILKLSLEFDLTKKGFSIEGIVNTRA